LPADGATRVKKAREKKREKKLLQAERYAELERENAERLERLGAGSAAQEGQAPKRNNSLWREGEDGQLEDRSMARRASEEDVPPDVIHDGGTAGKSRKSWKPRFGRKKEPPVVR
jgi:hypothetical protein